MFFLLFFIFHMFLTMYRFIFIYPFLAILALSSGDLSRFLGTLLRYTSGTRLKPEVAL